MFSASKYEPLLAGLGPELRSFVLPQIGQLGGNLVPVGFGVLASIDNGNAKGWIWSVALDDDRLINVSHILAKRDLTIRESPHLDHASVALVSCSTPDALRPPSATPATLDDERITASWRNRGSHPFPLPGNTLTLNLSVHYTSRYLAHLEQTETQSFAAIRDLFKEGADCSHELELRSLLRLLSPRHANIPGAQLYYQGLADQILAITNARLRRKDQPEGKESNRKRENVRLVVDAKALLRESVENPPTIEQLAALLHASPTSLNRQFKAQTGMSVGSYSLKLRMQHAIELLEHSDLSLEEVAHAVGYSHQSTFTTAFGKSTGYTPAAWRQESQQRRQR
jgi:AraC-like DNA-binding protein